MTPEQGAARLLSVLDDDRLGTILPSGARVFPQGVYIDVVVAWGSTQAGRICGLSLTDLEARWVAAVDRVLRDNSLRFRLRLVERDPTADEAVLRLVNGDDDVVSVRPVPLLTSLENQLKRLPGAEHAVRVVLDPNHILPGDAVPTREALFGLAGRYGAATPDISFAPLPSYRCFEVDRVPWRELAVGADGGVLPVRYTDTWIENGGSQVLEIEWGAFASSAHGFAVLPGQRIPWEPGHCLKSGRGNGRRLRVETAPFETLPARRVRPVPFAPQASAAEAVFASEPLLPVESRGARLRYRGSILRKFRTRVLVDARHPSTPLVLARGPSGTLWFSGSAPVQVPLPGRQMGCTVSPRFFFLASAFEVGGLQYLLHEAECHPWLEVRLAGAVDDATGLSWWISFYEPLELKLDDGTGLEFCLEPCRHAGGRADDGDTDGVQLLVTTREGQRACRMQSRFGVPSRFELCGFVFDVEAEDA